MEKPNTGASEEMGSDCSYSDAQELHVLAVDDSIVDRKVIERLLKISCCKGRIFFSSFLFFDAICFGC